MMEAQGFFHTANVGPGWRNAAQPARSDFDRLLSQPFKHLLSAHGAPLLDDAHPAVLATLQRLFDTDI